MNDNPAEFIEGAAQIAEYYDGWPTFHDADYVTISIDMYGPTLSVSFRLYDWDDVAQKANRPSITIKWHGVSDLSLSGIEELGQNAIGQMQITKTRDGITTLIEATGSGTTANFRAAGVEVIRFDPHEEWDYETRNTTTN